MTDRVIIKGLPAPDDNAAGQDRLRLHNLVHDLDQGLPRRPHLPVGAQHQVGVLLLDDGVDREGRQVSRRDDYSRRTEAQLRVEATAEQA
jgi:hypothetical protein